MNFSLGPFQALDALLSLLFEEVADGIIEVQPVIFEEGLAFMQFDLLDGFESFVLFKFGKLLFEDVDGVLDFFFPLFEFFAFEEEQFAEFD